jgi:hypothetical protein
MRSTLGILKAFFFLFLIRFAVTCHRLAPVLGDFFADRFGITAAVRRGKEFQKVMAADARPAACLYASREPNR